MGKSNRSINPADALRKKQRRRELKKNKDERKRARETVLAKKDVGRDIASSGQLAKPDQTRLDSLKAEASKIEKAKKNSSNQLTGAQAAYVARMQEHEKKHEGEARKMVYDPKSGKFVAAKRKGRDGSSDESIEGIEEKEEQEEKEEVKKEITESDDDYEIPLPPGPPPKLFSSQVPVVQSFGGRIPPPPPPLPHHQMPYHYQAYQHYQAPIRPAPLHYEVPPTRTPVAHYEALPTRLPIESSEVSKEKKPVVATISAEPQLRDLQKELLGFVPAAVRRKQAKKE